MYLSIYLSIYQSASVVNAALPLKSPVRNKIARRAPAVWNGLPLASRSAETYERFRSAATKKHFYELAFTN